MIQEPAETDPLVERLRAGDKRALVELFQHHRDRLRRMVQLRMDWRLQSRLDASDVLQEAFLDVASRLDDYLREPKLPPFLWLRMCVGEELVNIHRRHLGTKRRDAGREISLQRRSVPEASSAALASMLMGENTSPTQAAVRAERLIAVQRALAELEPIDREVVALRHFEQLSRAETAQVLGIREEAAAKRYIRAIRRLKSGSWSRAPAVREAAGEDERLRRHPSRPPRLVEVRPARSARRGVHRAISPGRAPRAAGLHRAPSRSRRGDPRAVPGPGADRTGRGGPARRRDPEGGRRAGSGTDPPAAPGRRLRDHPRGGPGRDGGRLRGRSGLARPPGGAEGPGAGHCRRCEHAGAVPPRGTGRGAAAPHQHRAGLRGRPRRGDLLLRDAVHRGPGARPGHRRAAAHPRRRAARWAPRATGAHHRLRGGRPDPQDPRPRGQHAGEPGGPPAPDGAVRPRGLGLRRRRGAPRRPRCRVRPIRDAGAYDAHGLPGDRGDRGVAAQRRRQRQGQRGDRRRVRTGAPNRSPRGWPPRRDCSPAASRDGAPITSGWPGSAGRPPRPWPTPTSAGSSTATSSRRTCCWTRPA